MSISMTGRARTGVFLAAGCLLVGCAQSGTLGPPGASGTLISGPPNTASPSTMAKDSTVIVGSASAKVTVAMYDDYRCPVCKDMHDEIDQVVQRHLTAGWIKVEYHPVALIDGNVGGHGSLDAGNAASCANQAGKYQAFRDALFAAQPDESDDAFGSAQALITIAADIPGLDSPTFEACVRNMPYGASVTANLAKVTGTPTIFIDGTVWTSPTPAAGEGMTAYQQQVAAAFEKALSSAGG